MITAERVVECAYADILDESVDTGRADRLASFARSLDLDIDPDASTLAAWTENIAAELIGHPFEAGIWNAFYDDLAQLFEYEGRLLSGRLLLLDGTVTLRRCGPFSGEQIAKDHPAVFFPPTTERAEDDEEIDRSADVGIPTSVSRFVSYMHRDLEWYRTYDGTLRRTEARDFLQKAGLVLRYDTRSLLDYLSRISQCSTDDRLSADILRLAYNLHKAANSPVPAGRSWLFSVPTVSGWKPASQVTFSANWPSTEGDNVERLISETHGISTEMDDLRYTLLVSPDSEPFDRTEIDQWIHFLRIVGVKDGLSPCAIAMPKGDFLGWKITTEALGDSLGICESDVFWWQKVNTSKDQFPHYQNSAYKVETPFYRLPGQSEHSNFSTSAKRLYARLIVCGLSGWSEEHFTTRIRKATISRPDSLIWATPLAGFVAGAEWMPVAMPSDRQTERYRRICESWHFADRDADPPPQFFPLIPREIRREVERREASLARLSKYGLKIFNKPEHAGALILSLGRLLAEGAVGDAHFHAFRAAYDQAWVAVITGKLKNPLIGMSGSPLVVSQAGTLRALPVGQTQDDTQGRPRIYVRDKDDNLTRQLFYNLQYPLFDIGSRYGSAVAEMLTEVLGRDRVCLTSSIRINIVADGQPVIPTDQADFLIVEEVPWFKDLIALLIDSKPRIQSHRSQRAQSEVQRKLAQIRARWAQTILINIDDSIKPLPSSADGIVHIDDTTNPTVLIGAARHSLDWEILEAICPAVTQLIDRSSIDSHLRLAVISLGRIFGGGPLPKRVSDADFAKAVNMPTDNVAGFRQSQRNMLTALLDFLSPIVCHYAGLEAAETISNKNEWLTTRGSVLLALEPFRERLPIAPPDLIEACEGAGGLEDLRDRLKITYCDFNITLRKIGLPPFHNEEGHENAFRFFTQRNRQRIINCLRCSAFKDFREGRDLTAYLASRNFEGLAQNPAWLDVCHLPDEAMMERRVNDWLSERGAKTLSQAGDNLAPVDELRNTNRGMIRQAMERATKIVWAWCKKNDRIVPPIWTNVDPANRVSDALDSAGQLDFIVLDESSVYQWLGRQGHWPAGMPSTTDLDKLQLTGRDLATGKSEVEKTRSQREREERTIEFGGNRYGLNTSECLDLVNAVRASITDAFRSAPIRKARLEAIKIGHLGTQTKSGGSGSTARQRRPSDAQKTLIGLVGELLVFEWLKAHFDNVDEACWKSKCRDIVLGGTLGDDGCGYDFEVLKKGKTLLFEVKATSSDETVIELGSSEVYAAQRATQRRRYHILFVPNVLDAAERKIHLLPNPFSEQGSRFFRTIDTGLRYEFHLL